MYITKDDLKCCANCINYANDLPSKNNICILSTKTNKVYGVCDKWKFDTLYYVERKVFK